MLWEKIANIKYTESTDTLSPSDAFFHTVDVLHWGYSWGLLLFVQAPDVNKEETRRRRLIHKTHTHTHNRTEHLRKMTRRGQHSTPKHKLSRQGEGKKQKKRRLWQLLVWSSVYGGLPWSCRTAQHRRHFCWTRTRWNQVKGWGSVRTEHRLSRKAEPGLDVWH